MRQPCIGHAWNCGLKNESLIAADTDLESGTATQTTTTTTTASDTDTSLTTSTSPTPVPPIPTDTTTSVPLSTSTDANAANVASSTPLPSPDPSNASSSHSPHTGAIVGGVLGALALLLLASLAFLLLRRRRRASHTPPSAEFMHFARGAASPAFVSDGTTTPSNMMTKAGDLLPLARYPSLEQPYEDLPPAFTPGLYRDPVFEKVHEAAAMREQFAARDAQRRKC